MNLFIVNHVLLDFHFIFLFLRRIGKKLSTSTESTDLKITFEKVCSLFYLEIFRLWSEALIRHFSIQCIEHIIDIFTEFYGFFAASKPIISVTGVKF